MFHLVHGWTGGFDSDDLDSLAQRAVELESKIKQLSTTSSFGGRSSAVPICSTVKL